MADYTYFLYNGAPNVAPNFSSWGALRSDFTANNRMGAGNGVIGAGVLTIKVRGNVTSAGNFNFVAAAGISVVAGGSWVIEADTNPWNALATNAAGFSTSFDGVIFGGDEGITTDLNNGTIRNLMMRFQMTGGTGLTLQQPAPGMTQAVLGCVLEQTLNNAVGVVAASSNVIIRNTVIRQASTNANAYTIDLNRRHSTDPTIEHCTLISNAANSNGVRDTQGSGVTLSNARNSYSGNATTPWGGLTAGSATGLASSTTGTPGTNAINSVALSTVNFESVTGSGDWRVKATSALATTGAARLASTLLDAYGRSRSTTTTIGMFAAEASSGPTFSTQPSNQTVTAPNTASFAWASSGTITGFQVQQRRGGGAWANVTDGSGASGGAGTNVSGTYTTTATAVSTGNHRSGDEYRVVLDPGGTPVNSNAALLTVNPPPLSVTLTLTGENNVSVGAVTIPKVFAIRYSDNTLLHTFTGVTTNSSGQATLSHPSLTATDIVFVPADNSGAKLAGAKFYTPA